MVHGKLRLNSSKLHRKGGFSMQRALRFALSMSFLVAMFSFTALSRAQSPFDGTWRLDPASAKFTPKPFTEYTSQGWFHCVSCEPPYDVAADGQDHAVSGHPYDTVAVTIVDDHTLKAIYKKDGKITGDELDAVSDDGRIMTSVTSNYPANGQVTHSTAKLKRMGVLRPGVHATSGNWVVLNFTDTENDLLFTFKSNGDELTMTDPTGDNYTAKFDGSDYPYKGAYGVNAVSLKKIDAHTIEETDKRDGTVISVTKMTVSTNGKSMTIVAHDPRNDTTSTFTATRK
jgi:hypothetical protein